MRSCLCKPLTGAQFSPRIIASQMQRGHCDRRRFIAPHAERLAISQERPPHKSSPTSPTEVHAGPWLDELAYSGPSPNNDHAQRRRRSRSPRERITRDRDRLSISMRGGGLDARDPQRLLVVASVRNRSQAPNGDRRREEKERQSSHGSPPETPHRPVGSEARKIRSRFADVDGGRGEPYRAGSDADQASEAGPNQLYDSVADTLVSLLLCNAQPLQ